MLLMSFCSFSFVFNLLTLSPLLTTIMPYASSLGQDETPNTASHLDLIYLALRFTNFEYHEAL